MTCGYPDCLSCGPRRPGAAMAGFFIDRTPALLFIGDGRVAVTEIDLRYRRSDGTIDIVRRGFPTDGASVPRLATCVWSRWNPRTLKQAVLHDHGYSMHDIDVTFRLTREDVDDRFYLGLCAERWRHADLYYAAVRLGGRRIWDLRDNVPELVEWWSAVLEGAAALDNWVASCRAEHQYLARLHRIPAGAA